MATRKNQSRGTASQLVSWLAVPRSITLPILLCIGAGVGWGLWKYVESVKILAWLSGIASPFCTMCATVIWAMRDKLEDAVNIEEMSANVYERFDGINESHRNRSTFMASLVALMSLVAALPAISNQLLGPVWEFTVITAGMAVTTSIYGYLLANYWDLQIRRYKSSKILDSKREAANSELMEVDSNFSSQSDQLKNIGMGWREGPSLGKK